MLLKSLNHIGIVVADLERTRTYYCDFLGMDEVSRPLNFTFGGVWFRAGGFDVHAILAADTSTSAGIPDAGAGKKFGFATHFAFEVDNLSQYISKAQRMGILIVGGPMSRGLGANQIYTEDPDGYMIELFEVTNQSAIGEPRGGLNG